MRIALVYDCLYPQTVGGAERWLRALAETLSERHEITYVTRRQWPRGAGSPIPGVRCISVAPGGGLYTASGRRRLVPPLVFGLGVLLHFVRNRRSYDVVHCLSYPFVPLLAVRLALLGRRRTRIYCEWLEYLSAGYWRGYAGRLGGALGRLLQWLCLMATPSAFVFSDLVASRLRASGYRGDLHRLTGLWLGERRNGDRAAAARDEPLVLFAGRHVPDKRVTVLPDAIGLARRALPGLTAVIVGDGPDRARVIARVRELGLDDVIRAPGFVDPAELVRLLGEAACVVAPSVRDGHGMVVVEAAAAGVPVVVCRSRDNAATELVHEGVNGAIAASSSPPDVADAILRAVGTSEALSRTTLEWFEANAERLGAASSLERVERVYVEDALSPTKRRLLAGAIRFRDR